MEFHKRTWKRLSTALIVAIAIAIAWGLLMGWGFTTVAGSVSSRNPVFERIDVTADGTPVITSRTTLDYFSTTYRTLDGKPIMVKTGEWMHGTHLDGPPQPPGLFDLPVPWEQRIASISDLNKPPAGWYLILVGEPLWKAYLVGYDLQSKRQIGFIGRVGFRSNIPPKEEQFDLGYQSHGRGMVSRITSTGTMLIGEPATRYVEPVYGERISKRLFFLIDGDRLLEIDLRTRAVRTLLETSDLLAVGFLSKKDVGKESPRRLAVRTADRVVILDPITGDEEAFVLPKSMRDRLFSVYAIGGDQLLLLCEDRGAGRTLVDLAWVAPDGKIAQQKQVTLVGNVPPMSERAAAIAAGVFAPVPVVWLVGGAVIAPLTAMQDNEVHNYFEGIRKPLATGWPALVIAVVLSLVAAQLALRLQRKYRRPRTGLWWLFVFLLGPAGLIAYLLEHRRAVLEPCAECGKIVPRDRASCADCATAFPQPPLVGTEIIG